MKDHTVLDASKPQKVAYCIPLWLRDLQIKASCERPVARLQGRPIVDGIAEKRPAEDEIAIVCYGPSLNDTWEDIRRFQYVMTCSGAHRFLIDRGIIPNWHVEVDPRAHKVELIGDPDPAVEYLIASTCHAAVWDHLAGMNVKLWHVFDPNEDGLRTLPHGEWALTGGCSVGLRAMTVARFMGFTNQHIFGMDGNQGASGKHAAAHPNQQKNHGVCDYGGTTWLTTPALLEAARGTFHELDQMPDVTPTFHGHGLVQAMAKDYVRKPCAPKHYMIGYSKPELISPEYRDLNASLHKSNLAYGVGGGRHAEIVLKLAAGQGTRSVLDYGCGKGALARAIPFPIWEYDPAIPGKQDPPRPADLVVCTDVLEHVEPEKLPFVLMDLQRCVKAVGYFTIHTGPAQKTLPDGRNTHLIQQGEKWWGWRLAKHFKVGKIFKAGPELHVIVTPLEKKKQKKLAISAIKETRETA